MANTIKKRVGVTKDALTPFNAMGNVYWAYLQSSNQMHITARQKHAQLFEQLRKDKITFKGIEDFLLAQAKRAGLYRECKWDMKLNKMRYLTKFELRNHSWYRELKNFITWVNRNWNDYGVVRGKVARRNQSKTAIITRKKSTGIVERTDITGGTIEDIKSGNTVDKSVQESAGDKPAKEVTVKTGATSTTDKAESSEKDVKITAPVTAPELTSMQIQQLVMQNLDVLGKLSVEKGCKDQFNALMTALGATDLVVE